MEGLEPTHSFEYQNLNLARLPISPHPRGSLRIPQSAGTDYAVEVDGEEAFPSLGKRLAFAVPARFKQGSMESRMIVFQRSVALSTEGDTDVVNITEAVQEIVRESGVRTGLACISGKGSTMGITTVEHEPGTLADLRRALDQIAPPNQFYARNARWGDENGSAHVRSALMGTTRSYPVTEALLRLGTWQQIVLCDFDDRPRSREVTVTVIGTGE